MTEENLSDRVLAQRVRNRIMEELSILAEGSAALERMGWDYLLNFLDWFPEAPELNPAMAMMLPDERQAVAEVLSRVLQFQAEARSGAITEDLLQLGRAIVVAPAAAKALALLNTRGRFDEEQEEDQPSGGPQLL
jgi:hypothetical protein